MRIWHSYGSEHSMDLVLVGRFETVSGAEAAIERMEALKALAQAEWSDDDWRRQDERMPDTLLDELMKLKLYEMGRSDVDIYALDHSVERRGSTIRIWTEESEVQGFLKVLIQLRCAGRGVLPSRLERGRDMRGLRQAAEATVELTELERLPGAADKNFEVLTRAIVSCRYGGLGTIRERRNQPGVEFYLRVEHPGALGNPGRVWGWSCKWFTLGRRNELTVATAQRRSRSPSKRRSSTSAG